MSGGSVIRPVFWADEDERRLKRDLAEVATLAPDLVFEPPPVEPVGVVAHHGLWRGRLPVWPFERPQPRGLAHLIPVGLECEVYCSPVHPVLPPAVRPLNPEPKLNERSAHRWHVAPSGTLCLMQSVGSWDPADSVADLLLKACGWRIEYELMKAGAVETMTLRGIVDDPELDTVIADLAAAAAETATATPDGAGDSDG